MKYLLDTNTCVYALKRRGSVVDRMREHAPDDFAVPIVTVAELWFGALESSRPEANRRSIDAFLKPFEVLPFESGAAEAYSRLRLALGTSGSLHPRARRAERVHSPSPAA